MAASSSSSPQVALNFRGDELHLFICHLEEALRDYDIQYFICPLSVRCDYRESLFKHIDDSKIALAFFSQRYAESKGCLNELVKIMDNVNKEKIRVIPIFFNVTVQDVKHQSGMFGQCFYRHTGLLNAVYMPKWKKALESATAIEGLDKANYRNDIDFIIAIVQAVKDLLNEIVVQSQGGEETNMLSTKITSEGSKVMPPENQVFIHFNRNLQISGIKVFIRYLVDVLWASEITYFKDTGINGDGHNNLFKRIEDSRIAIVLFSSGYTGSNWCLDVLVKIKERVEEGKLVAIPIFYKVEPSDVIDLKGGFGERFRALAKGNKSRRKWKEALQSIPKIKGFVVESKSDENEILNDIVNEVRRVLNNIPTEVSQKAYVDPSENSDIIKNVVEEAVPLEGSHETSVGPFENTDTRTSSDEEKDKTCGNKQRLNELKEKLDLNKITSQLGMIIGCLLLLFFVLQQIAYISTRLIGEGGAIDRIVENVPKVLEYIPAEGTENPIDKYTAKPERSSSDAKTNAVFLDRTCTNSQMDGKVKPPEIQVFINFRGDQLRNNFIGYLVDALRRNEINVFIDNQAQRGEDLNTLFKRIEDSGIAIVVFSSRYTESKWCLEELVKIKERVHQGLLKVLPIFYKVTPTNVKRLKGEFGDHFRDQEYKYESDEPMIKRWKEAIMFVSHKFALTLDEKSSALEIDFIETIVKEVLRVLQAISKVESARPIL